MGLGELIAEISSMLGSFRHEFRRVPAGIGSPFAVSLVVPLNRDCFIFSN